MNKPDWSTAPEWANYLAQDSDGQYWWYSEMPYLSKHGYWSDDLNRQQASVVPNIEIKLGNKAINYS